MSAQLAYVQSGSVSLASTGVILRIPPVKGGYRVKAVTVALEGATTAAAALQIGKYRADGTLVGSNMLASNLTIPSGQAANSVLTFNIADKTVTAPDGSVLYTGYLVPREAVYSADEYATISVVTAHSGLTAQITVAMEVL